MYAEPDEGALPGELRRRIAAGTRAAWDTVRARYPNHRFYRYTIRPPDHDLSWISLDCSSEEDLRESLERARAEYPDRVIDDGDLRWRWTSSPYKRELDDALQALNDWLDELRFNSDRSASSDVFDRLVFDICVHALEDLDRTGYFGVGTARELVVVDVDNETLTTRQRIELARRLNPPAAIEGLLAATPLPEASGDIAFIGSERVYLLESLALAPLPGVIAACGGWELGAWEATTGRTLLYRDYFSAEFEVAEIPEAVALASEGDGLYYCDHRSVRCVSLSDSTDVSLLTVPPGWGCRNLTIAGDGRSLALSMRQPGGHGRVTSFDAVSGERRWEVEAVAEMLAYSPDGRLLAFGGPGVGVIDARQGVMFRDLISADASGSWCSVAWFADGSLLAATSFFPNSPAGSGTLHVWHDLGKPILDMTLPGEPIARGFPEGGASRAPSATAFAPGGRRVATVHDGGELYVWSVPSGELVADMRGRWTSLAAVAWLEDHHVIAVGKDPDLSPPIGVWTIP